MSVLGSGQGQRTARKDEVAAGDREQPGDSQSSHATLTPAQLQAAVERDQHCSCLGEYLIAKIAHHKAMLYSLFIPIIEKLGEAGQNSRAPDEYLHLIMKYMPIHCQSQVKHEFKEIAMNQIKLFGLIAVKGKHLLSQPNTFEMSLDGKGSQQRLSEESFRIQLFKQYLLEVNVPYLKERFSVYLKREVLNLISLTAEFPFTSIDPSLQEPPAKSQIGPVEKLLDRFNPSLKYIRKMHFPLLSRELDRNSNEAQNFHVIIEAFLNMAVITKNLQLLRDIYSIIRE